MNLAIPDAHISVPPLSLVGEGDGSAYACRWRINGFAATILVWTAAQWERLDVRPADAQYLPCGIWCALRMD